MDDTKNEVEALVNYGELLCLVHLGLSSVIINVAGNVILVDDLQKRNQEIK